MKYLDICKVLISHIMDSTNPIVKIIDFFQTQKLRRLPAVRSWSLSKKVDNLALPNRAERTDSEGCPAVSAYTGAVAGVYPDEDISLRRLTCFSSILCALVTF